MKIHPLRILPLAIAGFTAPMAALAAPYTADQIDCFCARNHGQGYYWTGDGDGSKGDPWKCTNGSAFAYVVLYMLPADVMPGFASPEVEIYVDDTGGRLAWVRPAGGGDVLIWPTAPADLTAPDVSVGWPAASAELIDTTLPIVRPVTGESTVDFRVDADGLCGLDDAGDALWCVDLQTGALAPDLVDRSWSCRAEALDAADQGFVCWLE